MIPGPIFLRGSAGVTISSSRWWKVCLFFSLALAVSVFAGEIDESKLPPPATVQIDFARDIKPILENSCFRCHGPERPKSGFRLDNRESALKGGKNGVDILPGNSAKSPLIHYVARLVEDLEMPPPDKGEPLTHDQVALLRAWIDQGVAWETNEPPPAATTFVVPAIGYTAVSGDKRKFREHYWQKEGVNGGLELFELGEQTGPDSRFTAKGHLLRDDYKLEFEHQKNDLGFIHYGWERYRKYFDDTGGYDPAVSPSASSLDRDLHLDIGRAWIDFGLTLPDWPRLIIGYEYQYKNGEEAITQWGAVNAPPGVSGNIAPAGKNIDEHTHIIKFDLDHEIAGTRIQDSFRGEFYGLNTRFTNIDNVPNPALFGTVNSAEGYHHFQGANTLRLERQFTGWLFASGGYLYSKLSADASFTVNTTDVPLNYQWQSHQITLDRESHIANANLLLGPWDGLTISGGVQSEWTRQHGFGNDNLDAAFPGAPPFVIPAPVMMFSHLDTSLVEENLALRYTGIPFTSLFAEGRLRQEHTSQFESEDITVTDDAFQRDTEFHEWLYDVRGGFNTSPWTWASLSAHYRRYDDISHYDNILDLQPAAPPTPGTGYSAFIRARDLLSDEVETKLVLRPAIWFKTTLSYQLLYTKYRTDTDPVPGGIAPGGALLSGKTDSHIYSLNTTFIPYRRLYLSTTFSYQNSKTTTADYGSPSIAPYKGNVYSALANATCVLDQATDLFASYSFSCADYSQPDSAQLVPLGIRYQLHNAQVGLTRRLGKNLSTKLQYTFSRYDEPTSGGANNYTAHTIFGALVIRLP